MRLKSFHAKTMSEAMKLVRQTLGDDAIIVATREEESGGVRVTAAVEEDDHATAQARLQAARPAEPEIDVGEAVAEALHRHGVPASLAELLVDAAAGLDTEDPTLALGAALDSMFTFNPLPDARGGGGKTLVLVGPPGGGKTLTVAKLAARAVLKNRTVGVITTDTVRAGGVDQLAAFMRILKVKLISVDDPDALHGAIAVNHGCDLVLVDTAGRNPFDDTEMDDLRAMLAAAESEPIVVLPAGLDALEAADTGQAFKALGARRMLLTRLDMARRFGSMLVTAQRTRLSFCDGSVSAKVAEGLTPLNPVALARLMMPGQEKAAPVRPVRPSGPKAKTMSSPSSRTLP